MNFDEQLKERYQERQLACASACLRVSNADLLTIAAKGGIPAMQKEIGSLSTRVFALEKSLQKVLETA